MQREDGFYWVKVYGDWEIARWSSVCLEWYMVENMLGYEDHYFDEIDENRITRHICKCKNNIERNA